MHMYLQGLYIKKDFIERHVALTFKKPLGTKAETLDCWTIGASVGWTFALLQPTVLTQILNLKNPFIPFHPLYFQRASGG